VAYVPADRLGEGLIAGLDLTEHVVLSDPDTPFFVDWRAARERTEGRIQDYNIKGRPDSPVESLSGGNQQRVLQALLSPSLRLLLMEHPTRGLDIESAMWIWARLLERRQSGTAILFISSDLDEIVEYGDRVVVFSAGKMSEPMAVSHTSCDQLGYLIGGVSV
jgi:simple sugar transport system ATP-binding protein